MHRTTPRRALGTSLSLVVSLSLTACSTEDKVPDTAGTTAGSEQAASDLLLTDGWAKATDGTMTGVFGTLTNETEEDIHLTGVSSPVAGMGELHATVDDGAGGRIMKKAEDGVVVPAGGKYVLKPGADHAMLMELTETLGNGDEVEVTLQAEDGAEHTYTVPVRAFTGAEESYAPGDGTSMDSSGLQHGDDESGTSEAP